MKIIKRLLIYGLGGSMLLASCQRKNEVISKEDAPITSSKVHTLDKAEMLQEKLSIQAQPQRSMDDAVAIAQTIRSNMAGLRAHTLPAVQVECILTPKEKLKGMQQDIHLVDTAVYLVNFEGGGFAVISGDKRTDELLAISPNGNLKVGQASYGNGIDLFLSRLPLYCETSIKKFEAELDDLEGSFKAMRHRRRHRPKPIADIIVEHSDWVDVKRKPALLSTKWNQRYPYNDHAPEINGERAAAGCVATALAQLLAYHKFPKRFAHVVIDWENLTKSREVDVNTPYAHNVAALFRALGDRLGNSWGVGENGTGANSDKIPEILREMGYSNPSSKTDFDLAQTISSISQNKPVILSGFSETYTYKTGWWIFSSTKTGYRGGHAWVGDGYLEQERTVVRKSKTTGNIISTRKETRTLLHCNWGWGYRFDGYFLPNIFNSMSIEKKDSIDLRSAKNNVFQYDVKNILYVTP